MIGKERAEDRFGMGRRGSGTERRGKRGSDGDAIKHVVSFSKR
jgi:hypothetical protein